MGREIPREFGTPYSFLMSTPDLPARIQSLMEEVDRLREAGLQLWLSAGSAARILENGQFEIPDVRKQVAEDVRARMHDFKATKDRDFYPWETADPQDPRFMNWAQRGERITFLVINRTVFKRDGQRFVVFGGTNKGTYWLPDEYGEEPVQASEKLARELGSRIQR